MSSKWLRKLLLLITPVLVYMTGCSIHPFGDASLNPRTDSFLGIGGSDSAFYGMSTPGNTAGTLWISSRMDLYHNSFDVFTDFGAGGNHFVIKAMMGSTNMTVREDDTNSPYSGDTATKVTFSPGAPGSGNFMSTTLADGTSRDTSVFTINTEAMPHLAFRDLAKYYTNSLKFADKEFTNGSAHKYDYNTDKDGGWMEGTGFMALAYLFYTNTAKGTNVVNGMTNGNVGGNYNGVFASTKDALTTGYVDVSGSNWMIYRRTGLAATAMRVFADLKINPFWVGNAVSNIGGTRYATRATNYIQNYMDAYNTNYFVYSDANSGGNHFDQRGLLTTTYTNLMTYTEYETNVKQSGTSAIKVTLSASASAWNGMYYMQGVLNGTNVSPVANWGNFTNAGNTSLSGATTVSFWARGAVGGETVTFFTLGVGRTGTTTNIDPGTGLPFKYPDSNPQKTNYITLTTTWTKYTISLAGANLSYVLGGFGWSSANPTTGTKTFYIDNIYIDKNTTANNPRFVESYQVQNSAYTYDQTLANFAFTYDNALAALALIAVGDTNRARTIVDAFMFAMTNDRYWTQGTMYRLRNSYMSGDLSLGAGWYPGGKTNTTRMPGWWDNSHYSWYEDKKGVGSSTEANAWGIIAMLAYYEARGKTQIDYLNKAQDLGNFIENYFRSGVGDGGYVNGYTGWEGNQTLDTTKSVTANSAVYVAFKRLYQLTANSAWDTRATYAKNYVLSMWNASSGLFYQNGQLAGGTNVNYATTNWGFTANAGFNLTGATKVEFYAKGAVGGEKVEFFMGGIGRNDDGTTNSSTPYPDSTPKVTTGTIPLTTSWTKYTINLTGKNLSYIINGFGFNVVSSTTNQINFYIDDVKYDKTALSEKRFIVSYAADQRQGTNTSQGSDKVLKNSAYIYDQAMSVLSYLVAGENTRAQQVADALIYASTNDRFYPSSVARLRNAYSSGDLVNWPGWKPLNRTGVTRMTGYWDFVSNKYFEDKYSVGTATGNVAWVILAMLSYYQKLGGQAYLNTAIALGDWLINSNYSAAGKPGFTGGYDGWEPAPARLTYKSTEHNLDLYAAFTRLYTITGTAKWTQYATNCYTFVTNMWDPISNCFYTGTTEDGATISKLLVPLDTQVWTHLALRNLTGAYTNSFRFAEVATNGWGHIVSSNYLGVTNWGFDFDRDRDGMWFEGTGQMATGYMLKGYEDNAAKVMNAINNIGKQASGGIIAATKDMLSTGFEAVPGIMWYYFKRECLGATTWGVMADKRVNAFWIGTAYEDLPVQVAANTNTYGIFTETAAHSNTGYIFAKGGNLATWYGCGVYDTNSTSSGDSTNAWCVNVWVNDWFGWGVYTAATNLTAFSGGFLSFKVKSGITTPLKVGIKSTGQEAWVNLSSYGFLTNNTWQTINIPMSHFLTANPSLSFSAIEYEFMMANNGAPVYTGGYYVDDIYWGYTY